MSTSSSPTPDDAAWARVPEAARQHTAEGAEAFARFYLQQVNEAWMAPDPELIRPYALESCKTCANYVATADWLKAEHLHYRGLPMELGTSVVAPESNRDHGFIEMACKQLPQAIVRSDGSVKKQVKKRLAGTQVELLWILDSWQVGEVRVSL
jgi:hypothetical protein